MVPDSLIVPRAVMQLAMSPTQTQDLLRLRAALEAVKVQHWDQAERLFAAVMATPAATANMWLIYSAVAWHRGDGAAHLARLRSALMLDPSAGAAASELAAGKERQGAPDVSIRWLERALAISPTSAATQAHLARLLGLGASRSLKAHTAARRAVVLSPDNADVVLSFVMVDVALHRWRTSIQFVGWLEICCPDMPKALELRLTDRLMNGDGPGARALFERVPPGLEEQIVGQLLEPGGVVLDIGGNLGLMALGFLRAGASRVHCVEPNPDMVALLRANLDGAAVIHPTALGATDGEIDLIMPTGRPGAASIDPAFDAKTVSDSPGGGIRVRVPMSRLDSLDIERCDVWKLDVEGAENLVMQGARETLGTKPPRWLLVEIHDEPLRPKGHLDDFTRLIGDVLPFRYEVLAGRDETARLQLLPLGEPRTPNAERGTSTPLFLFAAQPAPALSF